MVSIFMTFPRGSLNKLLPIALTFALLSSAQPALALDRSDFHRLKALDPAVNVTYEERQASKPKFSQRTISDHVGRATALDERQKREIRAFVNGNPNIASLICTGTGFANQTESMYRAVEKRAVNACNYAKLLKPELITSEGFKISRARNYNGRVILVGNKERSEGSRPEIEQVAASRQLTSFYA